MRAIVYSVVCISLLAMAGCGGDEEEAEVSPEADACEHMIEGPNQAVTSIADIAADAPDLDEEHVRFDVDLAGDGTMRTGYVDLVIGDAEEHMVFLSADVPMTLRDADGNELAPEATQNAIAECTEVAVGYTFDFAVGTYHMELGPTELAQVQVVFFHPGGEHEEHEGH